MKRIVNSIYYRFFNLYKRLYIKSFKKKKSSQLQLMKSDEQNVIVSFTTISKRLNDLPLMLKSIFSQTVLPNRLIMYVYEGDFVGINLEKILKNEISCGLEIIYLKENLKSHKKYYYAMLDFPSDIIITVDDDIIYSKKMIENLLKSYREYPNCISAQRCHGMVFDSNSNLTNYTDWDYEILGKHEPSRTSFFTSGGGTLFPPNFRSEELFNKKNIKKLSFLADDVWLNMNAYHMNIKTRKSTFLRGTPVTINDDIENSLAYQNVIEGNNNDIFIKNMIDYYHLDFSGEK